MINCAIVLVLVLVLHPRSQPLSGSWRRAAFSVHLAFIQGAKLAMDYCVLGTTCTTLANTLATTACTRLRITRFARALPRNTHPRSAGASARIASASFSSSIWKARPRPSSAENTKAIHSRPGACCALRGVAPPAARSGTRARRAARRRASRSGDRGCATRRAGPSRAPRPGRSPAPRLERIDRLAEFDRVPLVVSEYIFLALAVRLAQR